MLTGFGFVVYLKRKQSALYTTVAPHPKICKNTITISKVLNFEKGLELIPEI